MFETTRPPKYWRCAPAGADAAVSALRRRLARAGAGGPAPPAGADAAVSALRLRIACPCCNSSTPRGACVTAPDRTATSVSPAVSPSVLGAVQPAARARPTRPTVTTFNERDIMFSTALPPCCARLTTRDWVVGQ